MDGRRPEQAAPVVGRSGIERAATAATLQVAADSEGQRRIRGVANTFGLMRSGRVIHPEPMRQALAANPQMSVPLLAQHGNVDGLATIGKVTRLAVTPRGLEFEALLARDTAMADDVWTLVQQGLLGNVSIGWQPRQARWVKVDEVDLDPHFKRVLEDSGESEAMAFIDYELVEISLVDVGDDRDAKLAAQLEAQQSEIATLRAQLDGLSSGARPAAEAAAQTADLDALRREVATLKAQTQRLLDQRSELQVAAYIAATEGQFDGFIRKFKEAAIEALLSAPEVQAEARLLSEEVGDGAAPPVHAGDGDAGAMLAQLDAIDQD